ncbi:MAG TPA: tryptophan synthase subunit beta [Synergistaceae bacterium]|jgi:tryptophan synthase beta chain|uniref:tryptophan synthase subunit beta n=1 Tax=Synergistaceae TaxID=649777 RepID=UPI000ECE25D6|nr:tryptophan synthase subunit beta [Synergistaceae bacterium DZ-S4]HAH68251.1 tryptophan synthase subunit beta [Synergistaceae bacterium]
MTERLQNQAGFPVKGMFGDFGGSYVPENLTPVLEEIAAEYEKCRCSTVFREEYLTLLKDYVGRPSALTECKNLTAKNGGARIFLKREDLNHTGAHKINNCIGQALLAKRMGKKKIIAETGAGMHGVASATVAALMGMECDIYMGVVDIGRQAPNVLRMKALGARVVPVSEGQGTLKEAVDAALEVFCKDLSVFYLLGSAVGPHPYPTIVQDFQKIIGEEARVQMIERTGSLPDAVVACVGGGSNAIGAFTAFIEDPEVRLIGVEPSGRGLTYGDHAASLTKGAPGVMHGFKSYVLTDEKGEPAQVYSIAAGLDYPSVGPAHAALKESGRGEYICASDKEALNAFKLLCRTEGIIPALESSHALAGALRIAAEMEKDKKVLVNLSGRGDKDMETIAALGVIEV